jgi:hypothetical protein
MRLSPAGDRSEKALKRHGKKIKRNLPAKIKNYQYAATAMYKNRPPSRQGAGVTVE